MKESKTKKEFEELRLTLKFMMEAAEGKLDMMNVLSFYSGQ